MNLRSFLPGSREDEITSRRGHKTLDNIRARDFEFISSPEKEPIDYMEKSIL